MDLFENLDDINDPEEVKLNDFSQGPSKGLIFYIIFFIHNRKKRTT